MDRIVAMQVFVNVVELGSLTAAANRMDISRAMATRYIASLEKSLGARLLHRTSRCLGPTNAGSEILTYCRQILALNGEIDSATVNKNAEPSGSIRVACSISFGQSYLAGAVRRYLARYPKTSVEMVMADHAVNMVEGRIDLAIHVGHEPASGMISRFLARCASVVCAAPGYLECRGMPLQPIDLLQHNCLNHTRFGHIWRFSHRPGNTPDARIDDVEVAGSFSANDAMVLLSSALAGEGIVHLPTFTTAAYLRSGALVPLLSDYSLPELDIYAVYASRKYLPATTRTLLDFLLSDIGQFQEVDWLRG